MFDINATLRWARGMITTPNETAPAYRELDPPWLQTFMQLPLPLYVAAALIGMVLAWLTGGSFGTGAVSVGSLIYAVVMTLIFTFVVAFLLDFFAGVFGGEKSFDRAYALVGLVAVIMATGNALGSVRFIGWLLNLGLAIYGLILMYRFIPQFLGVPEDKRVLHIISTIVSAMVISFILGLIFGGLMVGSEVSREFSRESSRAPDVDIPVQEETTGTILGGLERPAQMAEQAQQDTYEPPRDGKLSEDQVVRYISVMEKTARLRERLGQSLQGMDEKEPSLGDIFGGVKDALRSSTAEIEVVKTGGGNWAEHQWVRDQIEIARIQQDINDAVRHNFALFQKYRAEIEALE